MNYGTNMADDGTINFGYLTFNSGKKIMLSADECKEFEDRLRLERAAGKLIEQDRNKQEKDHYLLIMHGSIEAEVAGPFSTEDDRDEAALQHRKGDPDKDDGLHMVEISKGAAIDIYDYSGGFFMENDDAEEHTDDHAGSVG